VYWARWRPVDVIREQVRTAWRVVGAYAADGTQVGFARALSDGFALAYLADVYVLDAHRGHGLGKRIVQHMIDDGPGAKFRWMLHTSDAQGLYHQFGFSEPGPQSQYTYLERPSTLADRIPSVQFSGRAWSARSGPAPCAWSRRTGSTR